MKARTVGPVDHPRRELDVAAAIGKATIVIIYTALFFGLLPALLWKLGGRLDVLLALPSAGRPGFWAGVGALCWGAAWMAWSMAYLRWHGHGWPISHLPPRRLVARGPYSIVRHPIYVGYTAAFAGAGLLERSLGRGLIVSGLLTVGWLIYAFGFEEPRLERRHGAAYRAHRTSTPILPLPSSAAFRAAFHRVWESVCAVIEPLANRTILFRLGPTIWVTYGAWLAAGTAVVAIGLTASLSGAGVSSRLIAIYVPGLAAAMLLGGRLAWLLYQPGLLLPFARAFRRVGFVSWGGYLALFVTALLFARYAGLDPLWLFDRTLFWAFFASGLGRIGCLTYGCCYGRPAPGGVRWTDPHAKLIREHGAAVAVPRIPTQLLAALLAFTIAAILALVSGRPAPAGAVTGIGLLLYAFGRFGIDCLRDERRFGSWRLTAGQIGAAFMGGIAVALLLAVDGPPGWDAPVYAVPLFTDPLSWVAVVAAAGLVFISCGLHLGEVGRW